MKCPFCRTGQTRVVDTRPALIDSRPPLETTYRRRECRSCRRRFNTYEVREDETRGLRFRPGAPPTVKP